MKIPALLVSLCVASSLLACAGAGPQTSTDAKPTSEDPAKSKEPSGRAAVVLEDDAARVGSVVAGPALDDLPPPPPQRLQQAPIDLTHLSTPPELVVDAEGHTGRITAILYTSDGRSLITTSYDKTIRIWSAQTGQLLRTIRGERGEGAAGRILAAALSPDDRFLAVGGWLGTESSPSRSPSSPAFQIRLIDLHSGDTRRLLSGHSDVVLSLAFSRDGSRLLSGGGDDRAVLWDVATGRELRTLYGHNDGITGVAWSPDGSLIATSSADSSARVFDPTTGQEVAHLTGHDDAVQAISFTPSGRSVLTASLDGSVRIWEAKTGKALKTLAKVGAPIASLVIAPSGLEVVVSTASAPFATHVYQITTGRRLAVYTKQDNVVAASAISPNGKWAATAGGSDFGVAVWGLRTGKTEVYAAGHGQTVWNVGFQNNGSSIAWGHDFERSAGPYQINGRLEYKLPLQDLNAPFFVSGLVTNQLDYVRETERAAGVELRTENGQEHSLLEIWKDGRQLTSIRRDKTSGFVHRAFSLSPDGAVVVSGGDNGVLASFDAKSGHKLSDFNGHTGDILALAVSPDGRQVVTGSSDQTVRLWDLPTGQLLLTVFHARNDEWVAYTPSGYYAASTFGDGYIGWHAGRGPALSAAYFPASALSAQLHFEDVVRRHVLLGGDIRAAIAACNEALAAGLPKIAYYRFEDLPQFAPPNVYYLDPGSDLRIESDRLQVTARAHSPSALDIESFAFLINGRPIDERWMRHVGRPEVRIEGREAELSAILPLPAKKNRITVVAGNRYNESEPLSFDVERTGGPKELEKIYQPDLYLLSVGVSDYGSPHLAPLSYAHLDAIFVSEALEKYNHTIFRRIHSTVLTEAQAQKSRITAALASIAAQAEQKDLTLIFLSGYASMGPDGSYYFVPQDADTARLQETAVPFNELKLFLESLPSRVLVILDSSHAGELSGRTTTKMVDMSGLLRTTLSQESDVMVMTSSSGSELSYESAQWKHGAFTYALLEGLAGKADYDRDRFVFVRELELYLTRRVPGLTGGRQHPTIDLPQSVPNFPLSQR